MDAKASAAISKHLFFLARKVSQRCSVAVFFPSSALNPRYEKFSIDIPSPIYVVFVFLHKMCAQSASKMDLIRDSRRSKIPLQLQMSFSNVVFRVSCATGVCNRHQVAFNGAKKVPLSVLMPVFFFQVLIVTGDVPRAVFLKDLLVDLAKDMAPAVGVGAMSWFPA